MKRKPAFSFSKRLKSFQYAGKGIWRAVKTQHNLWIHLFVAALVIVAGIQFHISRLDWMVVTIAIGGVLSAEMFNTAIEFIVDLVSPEHHRLAAAAKDISAGAVLIFAIVSVIIGLMVFLPYLSNYL
ncbi:MAG: diacylglycerol kinase family protein [Bacteroidales bacterium]|jgi:diacylglycerol kinase|nr:diacylglycerol kinase family protein [Bacteroidales bacterium]